MSFYQKENLVLCVKVQKIVAKCLEVSFVTHTNESQFFYTMMHAIILSVKDHYRLVSIAANDVCM